MSTRTYADAYEPDVQDVRNMMMGAERHHFNFWVQHEVDTGTAAEMMVTQAVNKAIRRCKIGMVTRRERR